MTTVELLEGDDEVGTQVEARKRRTDLDEERVSHLGRSESRCISAMRRSKLSPIGFHRSPRADVQKGIGRQRRKDTIPSEINSNDVVFFKKLSSRFEFDFRRCRFFFERFDFFGAL